MICNQCERPRKEIEVGMGEGGLKKVSPMRIERGRAQASWGQALTPFIPPSSIFLTHPATTG